MAVNLTWQEVGGQVWHLAQTQPADAMYVHLVHCPGADPNVPPTDLLGHAYVDCGKVVAPQADVGGGLSPCPDCLSVNREAGRLKWIGREVT
jgi:hypothetical protein